MEKVPSDYSRKTHEGTKSESKSVQKKSHTENSKMGATSAQSSSRPLSHILFSSNVKNSAMTVLSTGVMESYQQSDITARIKNESTNIHKRSMPIAPNNTNDGGGGKKPRLENCRNISKVDPPLLGSNSRTTVRDFAHEFLDSDTSLSSSEEDISPSSRRAEVRRKIDKGNSPVLTPVIPFVDKSYAVIDKSAVVSGDLAESLESILEHETKASKSDRSDAQYSIKQYADMSSTSVISSQYDSPDRGITSSPLNMTSSTSSKVGDFANNIKSSTPKRSRAGKNPSSDQSSGRWTNKEHEAFLVGLKEYGREWKKVAHQIPTRTSAQIRSHAQKYFAKITRDEEQHAAALAASAQVTSINPIPEDNSTDPLMGSSSSSGNNQLQAFTPAMMERFQKILKDPENARREVEETLSRLHNRYKELQQTIKQKQQQRILERGDSDYSNNAVNRLQPHLIGSQTSSWHGNQSNLKDCTDLNNPASLPSTQLAMTVPLEIQQNNRIETTKHDRVVEPDTNIHECSSSDQLSLLKKELIPLHVLGDACANQENISEYEARAVTNEAYRNITRQTTVVENENIVEINDNQLQKPSQENDSNMNSHEGGINSTSKHS